LKKKTIIFWYLIPSPSLIDRLNDLNKNPNLKIIVLFSSYTNSIRNWVFDEKKWNFEYHFLNNKGFFFLFTLKYDLLVTFHYHLKNLIFIFFSRLFFRNVIIGYVKNYETWRKKKLLNEFMRYFIFNFLVSGFQFTGKDAKDQCSHYLFLKKKYFFAPWNYVSSFNYKNNYIPPGQKKINLLYVGRITPEKSIDLIIDASIQSRVIRENYTFTFVGTGSYEIEFIKKFNNLKNIKYVGFIQHESLLNYYLNSDAFIFPSLGEPYGIVIDEALSFHLPIICSNSIGELSHRVIDQYNGRIFNPNNLSTLISILHNMHKNRNLFKEYSNNSKKILRKMKKNTYSEEILKML